MDIHTVSLKDLAGLSDRVLGVLGERLAGKFLLRQGYRILERNARTRAGEIDIVAVKGETVRFIEVKTARSISGNPSVRPEERIGSRKLSHMERSALVWRAQKRDEREFHIDAITVSIRSDTKEATIEHIKDVL